MREPKLIDYLDMKIIMRKDFYDKFDEPLKKIMEDTGAIYIGHNIIKNYRKLGHTVSTFCNQEAWHDIYWKKFYNDDPMERLLHQDTQKNGFSVISPEVGQSSNLCGQTRNELTHVKDGVFFSFKRQENYYETFVFGWDMLKTDYLDTGYIFHLSSLFQPIRDYHWKVQNSLL